LADMQKRSAAKLVKIALRIMICTVANRVFLL